MACTGDSVVLLFSENYEIHVFKNKKTFSTADGLGCFGVEVYLK